MVTLTIILLGIAVFSFLLDILLSEKISKDLSDLTGRINILEDEEIKKLQKYSLLSIFVLLLLVTEISLTIIYLINAFSYDKFVLPTAMMSAFFIYRIVEFAKKIKNKVSIEEIGKGFIYLKFVAELLYYSYMYFILTFT